MAGAGTAGMMAGGEGRGPTAMFGALFSGLGILFIVFVIAGIIAAVFGYGWAYGAAEPVWRGGDPDIGGGFSKAMSKLGSLIVLAAIVGVVDALLFWSVIVPILIGLFCLYTIPYIMQGNQTGTGSIGASISLSRENFGPTAMLFLGLIVIGIIAGVINAIIGLIPVLGQIVAIAVGSLVGAYCILAVMRWYNLLTGSATVAAATVPPAPPPPTAPTA
jgi:hypothetical protein